MVPRIEFEHEIEIIQGYMNLSGLDKKYKI